MSDLRTRTVRGAAITAAFIVGIDAIVAAQGLMVTRLLGPKAIGLYGLVAVTVTTILTLKRVGIDEAFVQQETDDPETEFQYAFTLELALSVALAVVILLLAPVLAVAYGESQLLGLTLASAYLPVAFALLAPLWIFFRRMDYAKQRSLQVIQPVVSIAVTLPLADEVHTPEEDPGGRLQREREREVGDRDREPDQPVVAVDARHERRARRDGERERRGQGELECERALELLLLALLRLLDERLVDPHPLQDDDRHCRGGHDPVQADRSRAEKDRDDQALHEHERLGPTEEEPVHDRAARRTTPQLGTWEREALVGHAADRGSRTGPHARAARAGSFAPRCQP